VWLDVREQEIILSKKELLKLHMDETQAADENKWFDNIVVNDSDFPSGKAVGTEIVGDKCAFLDKFGRCTIQLAAVAAGEHKWAWKPTYCILFPVEVSKNVIGFDPMLQGDQRCCTVSSVFDTPLFVACKDELVYLLGEDGYNVLEEHFNAVYRIPVVETQG
jgi:hypothetical protein